MKLAAEQVPSRHHGRHTRAVIRHGGKVVFVRRMRHEAVHEIHIAAVFQTLGHGIRTQNVQRIPADLRQLETRLNALNASRQQTQTLARTHLVRFLEQHLHAEADTEERLFLCSLQHRLRQTGVGQSRHRIRKRADTGQDNARRILDHVRRSRDFILITQVIERVVYAHQIACAIIYDCNITHR